MTISFPLSLPTTRLASQIVLGAEEAVGRTESPFGFSPQVYDWSAARWTASMAWGEMGRSDADDVIGFLVALRGPVGSFLLGDPLRATQKGTWQGQSPLVNGASQTGLTLAIDGLTPTTTTALKGDLFQLGSGSTARLYMVTSSATANGSGQINALDIWPPLRGSPADNAPLTLSSPVGLFMLASNVRRWQLQDVRTMGISLDAVEDLRGL